MWKAVLAGTTALAIAGSSLVYAQQQPPQPPQPQPPQQQTQEPQQPPQAQQPPQQQQEQNPAEARAHREYLEDMRAFSEARLAALKAGLQLTPDQEKNWPAFENAARQLINLRIDRLANAMQRGEQPRSRDPLDRLRQMGSNMAATGNALRALAEAADPLVKSLSDSQKRRFAVLARSTWRELGPEFGAPNWREHRRHFGYGYRRGEDDRFAERGPGFEGRRWRDREPGFEDGRRWGEREPGFGPRWRDWTPGFEGGRHRDQEPGFDGGRRRGERGPGPDNGRRWSEQDRTVPGGPEPF